MASPARPDVRLHLLCVRARVGFVAVFLLFSALPGWAQDDVLPPISDFGEKFIPSVHHDQALQVCSLILKSEERLPSTEGAPESLLDTTIQGKWAYQKTSAGVRRHREVKSDTGHFDMWVEHAGSLAAPFPHSPNVTGVSALAYVTSQTENTEGYMGSITVRGEGFYDHLSGLLCLLGCLEDDSPSPLSFSSGNVLLDAKSREAALDYAEALEKEDPEASGNPPLRGRQGLERLRDDVCKARLVLRFRTGQNQDGSEASVSGRLESLRQPGDARFFSPIIISGATGVISSQIGWFNAEMVLESLVGTVLAACIIVQILHMRKHHNSYYVSLTMVSVQVFVYAFYWIRSIYWPLRYLNSEILLYFLSDVANLPRFVEFAIFVLYVYLAVLVDTKRRKAAKPRSKPVGVQAEPAPEANAEGASLLGRPMGKAGNSPSGPGSSELQLAVLFWPVYVTIGVIMWWTYDFDTFLRESAFLFLVPQLIANHMWNLANTATSAVSMPYAVGVTAAQIVWLTYEVVRPQLMGYDAFFAFPHAWYWSSLLLMILQLGAFVSQRLSGGRWPGPKAVGSRQGQSVAELAPTTLTGTVQP